MKDVEQFLDISPIDWTNITTKKYNIVNPNPITPPNPANNNQKNDQTANKDKDQTLTIQEKSNEYPDLDPKFREELEELFEPYNQLLYKQLGRTLW